MARAVLGSTPRHDILPVGGGGRVAVDHLYMMAYSDLRDDWIFRGRILVLNWKRTCFMIEFFYF